MSDLGQIIGAAAGSDALIHLAGAPAGASPYHRDPRAAPGNASAWSNVRARELLGFVPEHSWRDEE